MIVYNGELYGSTTPKAELFKWNNVDDWTEEADQLNGQTFLNKLVELNGLIYGCTGATARLFEFGEAASGQVISIQID